MHKIIIVVRCMRESLLIWGYLWHGKSDGRRPNFWIKKVMKWFIVLSSRYYIECFPLTPVRNLLLGLAGLFFKRPLATFSTFRILYMSRAYRILSIIISPVNCINCFLSILKKTIPLEYFNLHVDIPDVWGLGAFLVERLARWKQ